MSTPEPPDDAAPTEAAPPPPAARPEPSPVHGEDQPSTWQPLLYLKIAGLLAAIAYSIAFVASNTGTIKVDFVFWTANVTLIWEILLLLALGLVGGILLSQLHRHRRRAQLAKEAGKAGDAGPDVVGRDKAVGKPS